MMTNPSAGFDVDSYNKPNFNFDAAFNEGYGTAIVKLGGNNLAGNQPYRMNGYPDFANKQAKFPIRGAYWVTGGGDPHAAAVFYAQNRAPWTNLDIIDNEKLDSGNPWNDGQCAVFFDTLASFQLPNYNPWMYGSRDALWKAVGPWPQLQARRILALIAFYNGAPLQNIGTNYDGALTKGHQFTSSATIGGSGNIDANAFTADAFLKAVQETADMLEIFNADGRGIFFIDADGANDIAEYISPDIQLGEFVDAAYTAFGRTRQISTRQFDIAAAIASRRYWQKVNEQASATASALATGFGTDLAPAIAKALEDAGIGGTTDEQIKQITDQVVASAKDVIAAIPTTFTAGKVPA